MLTASGDKTCKLWDVQASQVVTLVYFHIHDYMYKCSYLMHSEFKMGDQVEDQQVSCLWQGEYLLSVSLSGHINYLDRNNPDRPLRVLKGHNKNLSAVASFNNGSTIYSASFDGRIDILNYRVTVYNCNVYVCNSFGPQFQELISCVCS